MYNALKFCLVVADRLSPHQVCGQRTELQVAPLFGIFIDQIEPCRFSAGLQIFADGLQQSFLIEQSRSLRRALSGVRCDKPSLPVVIFRSDLRVG